MASGPVIRLAVFGNPVAQSLSPAIHGRFAEQCGLNVDYQAIEATSESFPELTRALATQDGRGCNITAPFKNAAWKLAHRCSDSARRARAANTLVFESADEWYAHSTDGRGLVNDLLSISSLEMTGSRICLIGAGGAAASVLGALLRTRPETIVVANRSIERAIAAGRISFRPGHSLRFACLQTLQSEAPFDLIINATSLGHGGRRPTCQHWLKPGGLCYDMNYGAAASRFGAVPETGIPYSDGLGMLVGQAAFLSACGQARSPTLLQVLRQLRGPGVSPRLRLHLHPVPGNPGRVHGRSGPRRAASIQTAALSSVSRSRCRLPIQAGGLTLSHRFIQHDGAGNRYVE